MITSYIIPLMFLIIFSMSTLVRLWKSAPGGKLSAERMRIRKSVTKMVRGETPLRDQLLARPCRHVSCTYCGASRCPVMLEMEV
jgi:hypothetical protein